MFEKIKAYSEYKNNKKTAKRELAKMAAVTLPAVREFTEKKTDTVKFFHRLVESTKKMDGKELVGMVLNEVCDKLATDQTRLLDVLSYMVSLNPGDIQKILVHSIVETMPDKEKGE